MMDKGITYNEMEALRDCPSVNSRTGQHNVIEVYWRRIRDFGRKTYWFRCFECQGKWRHYRP